MRLCPTCKQPVPIRWRNDGPARQRQHVAGDVVLYRAAASRGYPWGRVVGREQFCAAGCDELLVRGLWAVFFTPGAPVIEHGERVPVLVEGTGPRAVPCTPPGPAP